MLSRRIEIHGGKEGELSSSEAAYVKTGPVQGRQSHRAGTQGTGWRGDEERVESWRTSKGPLYAMGLSVMF